MFRRSLGFAVAGIGPLSLVPAASAALLPKGTPYAAEVKAHITGVVHITGNATATTYTVCTPSGDAVDTRSEDYKVNWQASFPQITVPVITSQALGKAAKRLHVPITPTSTGTAAAIGGYHIQGMAPPTSNSGTDTDCQQKPFSATGLFGGNGTALYYNELVTDGYAKVHYWELAMVDADAFAGSPPTFDLPDGTTVPIAKEFGIWTALTPTLDTPLYTAPGWNFVNLRLDESKLVALAKPRVKSVEFKASDDSSKDCSQPADSSSSYVCSVKWTVDWTITLTRRFLYHTVRAYQR